MPGVDGGFGSGEGVGLGRGELGAEEFCVAGEELSFWDTVSSVKFIPAHPTRQD